MDTLSNRVLKFDYFKEGADTLLRGIVDVVIVDTSNAPWSEIEICSKIRAKFAKPLILLTDEGCEEHLVQAYQVGVDECIVKPISEELLSAKVAAWLRWSQPARNTLH